jgi:hypothetical protein
MAAAAWEATIETNTQLLELMPAIFAPTSTQAYRVSFTGACVRASMSFIHSFIGEPVLVSTSYYSSEIIAQLTN